MVGWKMARWLAALAFCLAAAGWWTPPGAAAQPAAAGDPRRGESLYIGAASFANGGAPCLGCHGIAGHGLAGGASYGTDLTPVYASYGDDLTSMLEEMPFPSMEPIYAGRPLTPEERADLTAFLAEVSGEPPAVAGAFLLEGGIGAALLLAAILAFGWRRLRGVRGNLVEETRQRLASAEKHYPRG
jgi:mono/diheme cytochrome c family protein